MENGSRISRTNRGVLRSTCDRFTELAVNGSSTDGGIHPRWSSNGTELLYLAPDGRLLVAGLQPTADLSGCFAKIDGPCGAAFAVHVVDPDKMQSRRVFAHQGSPLGLATVAVQAGDSLYIGTASGDRVMRVPAASWRKTGDASL